MSDNQLRAYRESFRRMIATDASDIIENISSDHAVVIIQELIRAAKRDVCIICHKLSSYVYENKETLDAINEALGRSVTFHVAVKSGTPEAIGCVNLLKSAKQQEIRRVCADSMHVPDFCVVDGKRWRIETHPEKREAKVCANDSVLGEKMSQVFKIVTRDA